MDTERQADQGPDETKFEYAARMQSMRHLYETSHAQWSEPPQSATPVPPPVTLYSVGFEGDDLLTVYAALRSYLKILVGQENEELKMIQRVVSLMVDIRPSAVKAQNSSP